MIRIRALPLGLVVLLVFFSGIGISVATGTWNTTASKVPAKISGGELAGMPDPSDIRGSYSWLDIEKAFGVPAAEAARLFSAPGFAPDPTQRVSTLETYYKERLPANREVGTDSVRLFVSRMTGLPHTPEEGTALPRAAVEYLEAAGKADDLVRAASIDLASPGTTAGVPPPAGSTLPAPPAVAPAASPKVEPAPVRTSVPATPTTTTQAHDESERKVGGSTTFGNLLDWGLSAETIQSIVGMPPGDRNASVRDAVQASGGSFSGIKDRLQKAVDSAAK